MLGVRDDKIEEPSEIEKIETELEEIADELLDLEENTPKGNVKVNDMKENPEKYDYWLDNGRRKAIVDTEDANARRINLEEELAREKENLEKGGREYNIQSFSNGSAGLSDKSEISSIASGVNEEDIHKAIGEEVKEYYMGDEEAEIQNSSKTSSGWWPWSK